LAAHASSGGDPYPSEHDTPERRAPKTTAVHGEASPAPAPRSLVDPIYRSSTFRFDTVEELREAARGGGGGFYTRYGHPNFERVERKFAALHGAEDAVLFASGMGVLAGVLQGLCRTGDRLVAQEDLYGGTRVLLQWLGDRLGIATTWVPTGDLDALAAALPGARLYLGESPSNPLLKVLDLAAVAAHCKAHDVLFVLDATFDGPLNLTPLAFGVDLVAESATKSLAGHSDLLGGLVAGSTALCADIRMARRVFGAIADPETAWLLDRGMKTLGVRIRQQNENALRLAERLEADSRAAGVLQIGLTSHPQRALILRQARRAGGSAGGALITFRCAAGAAAAEAFCDRLQLIANAPSLGGVESLVSLPRFTSHASFSAEEREAAGIGDDLVRLSIGVEDAEDLWADIDAALG
jgi:cystathionine beta-lyase/cystathionine gamma-synthase